MSRRDYQDKAKELANKAGDKAEEAYERGLKKLTKGHKPRVARSRIFVAGLITGVVLTSLLVWLL